MCASERMKNKSEKKKKGKGISMNQISWGTKIEMKLK